MRADALALRVWHSVERVGAFVAFVSLTPALGAISACVRIDSSGPILFRQERLGRDARPFTILKFRTMHADGERDVPQERRRVVESDRDPRITRAGRWLRTTSLDELPQLWNVVRGDMSLVGPRPLLPEQRAAMPDWAQRRFLALPGMTGLAQVKGRRSLSWLEQLEWDCRFVSKDRPALRAWILLKTLEVLARPEQTYGKSTANWRAYLPPDPDGANA